MFLYWNFVEFIYLHPYQLNSSDLVELLSDFSRLEIKNQQIIIMAAWGSATRLARKLPRSHWKPPLEFVFTAFPPSPPQKKNDNAIIIDTKILIIINLMNLFSNPPMIWCWVAENCNGAGKEDGNRMQKTQRIEIHLKIKLHENKLATTQKFH